MARTTHRARRGRPQVAGDTVPVFAWNAARLEFDALEARRTEQDVYEVVTAPRGSQLAAGDLVRCELSDGELLVLQKVWLGRMV